MTSYLKKRHKSKGNTTTWIGTEVEGDAKIVITIWGDHIYARVEVNDIKVLYSPGDSPFQVVTLVTNPAFEIMPDENDIVTAPPAPPLMPHPPPLSAQGAGNDDGSGMYCNENVLAHEFGHNAGCTHDIGNANNPGRYSYSYGYQHPTGQFRTVMAYSYGCPGPGDCTQIDYFSNPNVTYNGAPTGTASANCAETIQQTWIEMAGYRQWKPSPPVRTLPVIIDLLIIE